LVTLTVFLAAGAVLVALAILTKRVVARQLGIISVLTALASVFAVSGIRGEVYWYLTLWMSVAAVPLLLGWLLLLIGWLPSRVDVVLVTLAVVAGAAAGGVAVNKPLYDNRAFPMEGQYRAQVVALWRAVAPALDSRRPRSVVIDGDLDVSPAFEGVAARVERGGVDVRVPADLESLFGREFRATGREELGLWFTRSGPAPPGGVLLGEGEGIRSYTVPVPAAAPIR
jgi:hypothetical protein